MLKYLNCAHEYSWSHKSSQMNMCKWCLNMSKRGCDVPSVMVSEKHRDVVIMFHLISSISYRHTDFVMFHLFYSCMSNMMLWYSHSYYYNLNCHPHICYLWQKGTTKYHWFQDYHLLFMYTQILLDVLTTNCGHCKT